MDFKNDKRSVKTRRAIKIAFLKLLRTHDISEVNITEITRNAGINRNSFYTHYKNVNNILDDINNEICSHMETILERYSYEKITVDPHPVIADFSKVVVNNKYITEYLLFSKSSTDLVRKLKDIICDRFYDSYIKAVSSPNPITRYVIAYIISGVFEMYHLWYRTEKSIPIETVTEKVSKFILKGVSSITL